MLKKKLFKGLGFIGIAFFALPLFASEPTYLPVVTVKIEGQLESHKYLRKNYLQACIQDWFKKYEQVKFIDEESNIEPHLSLNVSVEEETFAGYAIKYVNFKVNRRSDIKVSGIEARTLMTKKANGYTVPTYYGPDISYELDSFCEEVSYVVETHVWEIVERLEKTYANKAYAKKREHFERTYASLDENLIMNLDWNKK